MATYGYLRVSTDNQNTENQKKIIQDAGFAVDHWYYENGVSGSTSAQKRTEFSSMIKNAKTGDTVICTAIDRLGRSASDILNSVDMFKDKGIKLRIVQFDSIDITSAVGRMILTCMSAMAELERNLIVERTKAGLSRTKSQGTKLGQPLKIHPTLLRKLCQEKEDGATLDELTKKHNVPRNSIARNIGKWKDKLEDYEEEFNARKEQYKEKKAA
jgi:DNA invertase Pin-like site-specific DNA recombinase